MLLSEVKALLFPWGYTLNFWVGLKTLTLKKTVSETMLSCILQPFSRLHIKTPLLYQTGRESISLLDYILHTTEQFPRNYTLSLN